MGGGVPGSTQHHVTGQVDRHQVCYGLVVGLHRSQDALTGRHVDPTRPVGVVNPPLEMVQEGSVSE